MAEKFNFKFFGLSVEAEGAKSILAARRSVIYGLIAAIVIFAFGTGPLLSLMSAIHGYFVR